MRQILIDSGILLSYYQADEPLHGAVVSWCDRTVAELVTSPICIAETLWLLGDPGNGRVLAAQNHLLQAVASGGILTPALEPGDFADLSLVLLSEQLGIAEILSLDSDFDVYRRFRRQPFQRVSLHE
jgi:predicted nucleic acid-binding protein